MTDVPETRWARTVDDACIAYQDIGSGPVTLVVIHGWVSHLESTGSSLAMYASSAGFRATCACSSSTSGAGMWTGRRAARTSESSPTTSEPSWTPQA